MLLLVGQGSFKVAVSAAVTPIGSADPVPVEALGRVSYPVAGSTATVATKWEAELVARYQAYLEARGSACVRYKLRPSGELRDLYTDLLDQTTNVLYEAKGVGNPRGRAYGGGTAAGLQPTRADGTGVGGAVASSSCRRLARPPRTTGDPLHLRGLARRFRASLKPSLVCADRGHTRQFPWIATCFLRASRHVQAAHQ